MRRSPPPQASPFAPPPKYNSLTPGSMSQLDDHQESEQPLFEKNVYSNISSDHSHGKGNHHQHQHHHMVNGHSNGGGGRRSPSGQGGQADDDMDPRELKLQQAGMASFCDQQQVLEARVVKLQALLRTLGVVTVAGFVILIVLCAVFFCKLNYDVTHHTHKPKLGTQMAAILQEGLCVSCEDFAQGPSPEEERMLNRYRDESSGGGGSGMCCVDKPSELLELLKLFIGRRFRLELAKGTVSVHWPQVSKDAALAGPRPAAHFMMPRLDMSTIQQIRGKQYPIDKWLHDGDNAFATGGAYHRHGRIVVPMDGYYFVYSQISFIEIFGSRDKLYLRRVSNDSPSLSIYLYRYNILYENGGEEKLAQNSITKCWGQTKSFGEYTTSLGAVFFLRQKDEIFIKVSNISMVVDEPKSSYFGFFKV